MRKINSWHHISADGFFAAPDGGLDWVVQDRDVQRARIAGLTTTGVVLFGRTTYEMFAAYWQRVLERPHKPDRHGSAITPELVQLAQLLTDIPKVVFSRDIQKPKWKNTRIVRELEPRGIARMKQDAGRDVLVLGSGSIVQQLSDHGLIDYYDFMISPTLLREGRHLLGPGKRTSLRLVDTSPFPTGSLLVRYARAD